MIRLIFILLLVFFALALPALELPKNNPKNAPSSLNFQPPNPDEISKHLFYYEVVGELFPTKVLKKNNQNVPKFMNRYEVKKLVADHPAAYEEAILHERYGIYANWCFLTMMSGIGSATIGTLADKEGLVSIGLLITLIATGPYLYYGNQSFKHLNRMINFYNEVEKPVFQKSSLPSLQKKNLNLVHLQWSF